MTALTRRNWVPVNCEDFVQKVARATVDRSTDANSRRLEELAARNREIHERDCFNLNPATNVMNPKAAAMLSCGLGERPSLGYPADKYETGLEAIEEIEVMAAELAAEVFHARHAEVRVPSGAIANLYAFMATCKPGDTIIAPPAVIGGHVTHHDQGCAGLYGLNIHAAPVDAGGYTVDLDALDALAQKVRPTLITIGGSLNLFSHPVGEIREIADAVGAKVLFDAAHQCGMVASRVWPDPLAQGADLMTMSTYKSLGGPASGLIVTNSSDIAETLDKIAFPGMTANFDAAKSAALAMTMLDWKEFGEAYGRAMIETAQALAVALDDVGIPVFAKDRGFTTSHQFAIEAAKLGGGQTASKKLRTAGFLACGIGLPIEPVKDDLNGLRIGTPELVRWGMTSEDMPKLADLVAQGLTTDAPEKLAGEVRSFRREFSKLHFIRG